MVPVAAMGEKMAFEAQCAKIQTEDVFLTYSGSKQLVSGQTPQVHASGGSMEVVAHGSGPMLVEIVKMRASGTKAGSANNHEIPGI